MWCGVVWCGVVWCGAFVILCFVPQGLRVRMGLHTGEPACVENPVTNRTDYYGRDVNYAARISSLGLGGQIFISAATVTQLLPLYSDVAQPLDGPAPFGMARDQRCEFRDLQCWIVYLGTFPLKGISDEEHVFQVDLHHRPTPWP